MCAFFIFSFLLTGLASRKNIVATNTLRLSRKFFIFFKANELTLCRILLYSSDGLERICLMITLTCDDIVTRAPHL